MKRLISVFSVLVILALLSVIFSVAIFAADSEEIVAGGVTGETDTSNATTDENSGSQDMPSDNGLLQIVETILGSEFLGVATTAIDVVILVIIGFLKKKTSSTSTSVSAISSIITSNDKTTKEKLGELRELVEAEREAIDKFKCEIKSQVEATLTSLREEIMQKLNLQVTHEQLLELVSLEKAQLDIFDTIYQHSTTIPTSTKERIGLMHNEAMQRVSKLEEDDAQ